MGVVEIIGGALLLICGIGIIVSTMLQESSKGGALGSLTGAESYYNQNKGRTREAMLVKVTKYLAAGFFAVTLIVYAIDIYL